MQLGAIAKDAMVFSSGSRTQTRLFLRNTRSIVNQDNEHTAASVINCYGLSTPPVMFDFKHVDRTIFTKQLR